MNKNKSKIELFWGDIWGLILFFPVYKIVTIILALIAIFLYSYTGLPDSKEIGSGIADGIAIFGFCVGLWIFEVNHRRCKRNFLAKKTTEDCIK